MAKKPKPPKATSGDVAGGATKASIRILKFAEQLFGMSEADAEHAARMRGLANLARQVFLDRNAMGMPTRERAAIRANARRYLRAAIRHIRDSRNALRAGDVSEAEEPGTIESSTEEGPIE